MEKGTINGRPFSQHTVSQYNQHVRKFLVSYGDLNLDTLKSALMTIPVESFGKKDKFYKAITCFIRYLIAEGIEVDPRFLDSDKEFSKRVNKTLRPRRYRPPRQHTVDEAGLNKLFSVCGTIQDTLRLTV